MQAWNMPEKPVVKCPKCSSEYTSLLTGMTAPDGNPVTETLFGCGKCGHTFSDPTEPLLCPTCKRVLEQIEADANDPYYLYCDECDTCYSAALEKESKEVQCYNCNKATEYDVEVRDNYRFWCQHCNLWHDANGKPQPGSHVWRQVPDESDTHREHLEAVTAAAVGLFTRHGKDLIWIPSAVSRATLRREIEALIASGWRPKSTTKSTALKES